ncbi:MAG: carbon-nitrogen hydrolase family protein [Corynebacterium casei]|uniref:carbon-nitrogen hydrolase family protein n=1 Tax=Corynebacterium stationis TaxID=1705 RepID=UPI00174D6963|nr:carbon-nitrogen hydrolase family protein [Corynebacterium stationis]MDO5506730.1 carbon-nitrogen hydrolase family protein [Corynebacterium casei]
MKVAAVQFVSGGEINENLTRAKELISTAAGEGAQLIVLPEATAQSFASGRLDVNAQELDGDFATQLKAHAEELGVTVVAGMFRPADSVDKGGKTINRVYNTALITGPGVHLGYNKIHTYDAFNYRESDTVKPGNELVTFELDGVTIGVAICYDVRFPEQFKALARQGAEVIVVPTSWADGPEKRDQWRLLSATRALDSTAYVICAGQARPGGNDKAGEASGPTGIGHSVIVSPTAERLAEAGYEEEIIYADIDPELVAKTRKTLPVLEALS